MRTEQSGNAPTGTERTKRAASRRSSFYRWPQYRLVGLLGWALIATGGAGWIKYHVDLVAEEEQVLQKLADAGCTVEVVRSYRDAEFDGRYPERLWYEPSFLERVRELRVKGRAPSALLTRAASLPGVTKFRGNDAAWGRTTAASETLGQPAPELQAIRLSERDLPSAEPTGTPVDGAAAQACLDDVRESWMKTRTLPDRFVLHGFQSDRTPYGAHFARFLGAQDATKALLQQESVHLVELSDSEWKTEIVPDVGDRWALRSRAADDSQGYVRHHLSVACRVKSLPGPKVETASLDGKATLIRPDGIPGRVEGPTVRRLDDSTLRIDVAEIHRWDDEAGVTIQRHARTFIVSEAYDWLPIAKREELIVEGPSPHRSGYSEAYRYVVHEGQPYVIEQLQTREAGPAYRSRLHARYAWDFDPRFQADTFDPQRFVGPELTEPGVYPFRWYWLPFAGGAIVLALRFVQRCVALFRRRPATTQPATSA